MANLRPSRLALLGKHLAIESTTIFCERYVEAEHAGRLLGDPLTTLYFYFGFFFLEKKERKKKRIYNIY